MKQFHHNGATEIFHVNNGNNRINNQDHSQLDCE